MYRVIIVDDEKLIRRSIEQRINWQKLGLTIAGTAGNGQEALELIAAVQPHIVLVDIRMPLMDGLSLIREAQRRGFDSIFFVIISGYNDFSYARQAIRLGVSDYIQKPVEEKELEQTLRQIIGKLECRQKLPETTQMNASRESRSSRDLVEQICSYINQAYCYNLGLKEIACQFHLNPSYLSQVFKVRSGKGLAQYIEEVRIDKSKFFMETEDLSVTEIASRVGYNDANYFSKVFKKNTGQSPSQYLEQVRQDAAK